MRKQAIDTHVHFWEITDYQPFSGWFGEKTFLERDYLPNDLAPHLKKAGVEQALIVGAAPDAHAHNLWCGALVEEHDTVAGLVGSYSLEHKNLPNWLDDFADKPWFVGIRAHPAASPEDWATDSKAVAGIAELKRRGLTLDMLLDHTLLPAVVPLAAKHPDLPIVINHCGLPPFREGDLSVWAKNITGLAALRNVFVKYSSFFLHCYPNCNQERLEQTADVLFESFGTERLLWGSNWPPELVGGTYQAAFDMMLACADGLSNSEYNRVFRENARAVYKLNHV